MKHEALKYPSSGRYKVRDAYRQVGHTVSEHLRYPARSVYLLKPAVDIATIVGLGTFGAIALTNHYAEQEKLENLRKAEIAERQKLAKEAEELQKQILEREESRDKQIERLATAEQDRINLARIKEENKKRLVEGKELIKVVKPVHTTTSVEDLIATRKAREAAKITDKIIAGPTSTADEQPQVTTQTQPTVYTKFETHPGTSTGSANYVEFQELPGTPPSPKTPSQIPLTRFNQVKYPRADEYRVDERGETSMKKMGILADLLINASNVKKGFMHSEAALALAKGNEPFESLIRALKSPDILQRNIYQGQYIPPQIIEYLKAKRVPDESHTIFPGKFYTDIRIKDEPSDSDNSDGDSE